MKTTEYKPYFGQYDPNKKDYINDILDKQNKIFRDADKGEESKSLPKRALILGGGIFLIIGILVIYKYK